MYPLQISQLSMDTLKYSFSNSAPLISKRVRNMKIKNMFSLPS